MSLSVNANVDTVVVVDNTTTVDTIAKVKTPTLLGKYTKFMQFGFWLSNQVEDPSLRESLMKSLKIHDSLDEQTTFYQAFLDESKTNAKSLRSAIADVKKQTKNAAKLAAKAEAKAATKALKESVEKTPRAPRAKKNKNIVDAPSDLISQLVDLANSDTPIVPSEQPVVTPIVPSALQQPLQKKRGGPKKKTSEQTTSTPVETTSTPVDIVAPLTVTTTPVQKKRGPTKNKKNTPPPTLPDSQNNADDDDLDVEIVLIDGQQFLVDADKNLYDFHSHLPLNRKI